MNMSGYQKMCMSPEFPPLPTGGWASKPARSQDHHRRAATVQTSRPTRLYKLEMVCAFIIHTLLPGTCRVLYSRRFAVEFSCQVEFVKEDATARKMSSTDIRQREKRTVERIAATVHSEYQFRRAVAGSFVEDDMQRFNNEESLPDFEYGIIRLPAGKFFQDDKSAVWLGAGNSGFTMVCDKGENLMMAESVLKLVVRFLQEHTRILGQQTENLLKCDRITMVVEQFLPNGILLFMNHRVIRQMEKELETLMKG
ncbi:AP-5 complex subunit sigma-1-like [Liolophura sinensis]|uniref:AP-5 complex subunit sigma-1-like n=1 Tax=Liolophura sinensis TaxID=3198878 RepID=UPI0031596069